MRGLRPARRLITMAVGACLLFPAGSDAASTPTLIRLAHVGTEFRAPAAFSSGGEFAIAVAAAFTDGRLISMSDGTVSASTLTRAVPTANGAFVFGSEGGQTIDRYDVESGVTTSRVVPFQDPFSNYSSLEIADADSAGRFVLFRASSGNLGRAIVFLFDFDNGTLVRRDGDSISGDVTNAFPEFISQDGTKVVYSELRNGSSVVVHWDRTTDTRTEFAQPDDVRQLSINSGGWDLSPDFEWEVFSSDVAVIPGLEAAPRYYRRHLASGVTEVVPVAPFDVRRADIYNGGRVVMRVRAPTTESGNPNGTEEQLFLSDLGQPARQISVKPDGTPADHAVGVLVAANADATAISFTSFDRDLNTGTGEFGWRWYVAEIPAAIARIDGPTTATATAIRCSQSALC